MNLVITNLIGSGEAGFAELPNRLKFSDIVPVLQCGV
jgi:hypothetical protein